MDGKARITRYLHAIRANISDRDTIETLLVNFENGAYERAARFVEKNAVSGPANATSFFYKAANGIRRLKKEKTF